MQQIFVLDTSVLIHDPDALNKFEDNQVMMPVTVIEELDNLRNGRGLISDAAQQALRRIDDLRRNGCRGDAGLPRNGHNLRILADGNGHAGLAADDRIIRTAVSHQQNAGDTPVVIVSKDISLRIKAEAYGIKAQDYMSDQTELFTNMGGSCLLRITPTALNPSAISAPETESSGSGDRIPRCRSSVNVRFQG
jgi:PhoH-like ATPase